MARCDEGYLCKICQEEVELITESSLYLRYVIGEIDPERLHLEPDKHLRCLPTIAQFIEDERFEPMECLDPIFNKSQLDPEYVVKRTQLISEGYRRLWEIKEQRRKPLTVVEYPLAGFLEKWKNG